MHCYIASLCLHKKSLNKRFWLKTDICSEFRSARSELKAGEEQPVSADQMDEGNVCCLHVSSTRPCELMDELFAANGAAVVKAKCIKHRKKNYDARNIGCFLYCTTIISCCHWGHTNTIQSLPHTCTENYLCRCIISHQWNIFMAHSYTW